MSFEQIRVFMGLDVSAFSKGLTKARAMVAAQGKEMKSAASSAGLGGLINLAKNPLTALIAAPVAIAAGLKAAGERAQHLRDMAQETGLALDSSTRNAAALGDRFTSAGNVAKKAWNWYAGLFEQGLNAMGMGSGRNTSAAKTAKNSGDVAETGRSRAIQDANISAMQAILLTDDKIATKEQEIAMLGRRQVEDKTKIEKILSDGEGSEESRAAAGRLQQEVASRNLSIISKTGDLEAEKLQRSRELAASEEALWDTEKQRYEINASHGQKMQALDLQARKIEERKAQYAGDTVKQNELQNQANQIRNEILSKEKEYKLAILAIDQASATQAVSVMLNNDLRMVELLKEQEARIRSIAATMKDGVERGKMIAEAQSKANQALQIYRAMRERVLSDEAAMVNLRREFMHLGEGVFSTDVSRAKLLREQAEDQIRLANLEQDREVRAEKLLAAQQSMNQAIAAELKTRTSISGLSDIANPRNNTERGRMARKAEKLYDESKKFEERGQFGLADNRRSRAQAIEEGLLAPSRKRLQSSVNPKDTNAGKSANAIFVDMKKELEKINKTLGSLGSA